MHIRTDFLARRCKIKHIKPTDGSKSWQYVIAIGFDRYENGHVGLADVGYNWGEAVKFVKSICPGCIKNYERPYFYL